MNQVRFRPGTIVLLTAVSVITLFASGCDCNKKLESLRKENQFLNQRIATLESQLRQADAAFTASTPVTQLTVGQSVYLVIEGDTLWGIAKKRLGSGPRYKEILALNPYITKDRPLVIGTKLILPPR
jgi:nucleoid-associated protein YgaU